MKSQKQEFFCLYTKDLGEKKFISSFVEGGEVIIENRTLKPDSSFIFEGMNVGDFFIISIDYKSDGTQSVNCRLATIDECLKKLSDSRIVSEFNYQIDSLNDSEGWDIEEEIPQVLNLKDKFIKKLRDQIITNIIN